MSTDTPRRKVIRRSRLGLRASATKQKPGPYTGGILARLQPRKRD